MNTLSRVELDRVSRRMFTPAPKPIGETPFKDSKANLHKTVESKVRSTIKPYVKPKAEIHENIEPAAQRVVDFWRHIRDRQAFEHDRATTIQGRMTRQAPFGYGYGSRFIGQVVSIEEPLVEDTEIIL